MSSLTQQQMELRIAASRLRGDVLMEAWALAVEVRLWWMALMGVPIKRVIGAMGLRSHQPGGNAQNRRQYYRHPVRHSPIHLWTLAYNPRKET